MIVKNVEIDGMTHDRFEGLGGASMILSRKGLDGGREGVSFEEGGEDCGFDSNKYEVVPKVDDVSLVDGVFKGAFGGDGDKDFLIGEGVVVSPSSLVKSTTSFLSGMMVSLIFLKGLEEEIWVEAIKNLDSKRCLRKYKNVAGSIEKIVNCIENQEHTVKVFVTHGGGPLNREAVPDIYGGRQPTLFPQESSKISKFANA
nr:hypothetical protein [Tanacetum cinerariifolium]